MPLADRATLGNMAPEFGSTCGIFPIDEQTIRYLELSGRDSDQIALVEAYAKAQGMWRKDGQPDADYTDVLELDMGTVVPSLAGPKRPQDRIPLTESKSTFEGHLAPIAKARAQGGKAQVSMDGKDFEMEDGAVLIAAITSCTNTSNPAVLVAAGLLARKAAALGLSAKPWVKTSLAPGSRVVTNYLDKADLTKDLQAMGFYNVGYGCTTCIGNSGPLRPEIANAVTDSKLVGTSVLSGNRNFEGRIHALVQMNFLASPPLVVAYALAGSMNVDLYKDPLGTSKDGKAVFLKDIWPSQAEVAEIIHNSLDRAMFQQAATRMYSPATRTGTACRLRQGEIFDWDPASTYVQNPPYFDGMTLETPGD